MNWSRVVRRHARHTGADLPPGAVDELAAHLEDEYLAARAAGQTEELSRARALQALRESPLAIVVDEPHRRFREATLPASPGLGAASPFRSTSVMHALRLAFRQLAHHRTFAAVTIAVLGLGIGASVAVYSVADAILLKPLPYEAPHRLVAIWETNQQKGLVREPVSPVNFGDYRALQAFADAAAWWRPDVNLTDPGLDPVRVKTIETSANLFRVLGVRPQVGPGFPHDGPFFSSDLVAVISDRLWRTRYQSDPSIIGRQLRFNGTPFRILGVMPERFDFPGDIDVWQRLRWDPALHSRNAHFMETVGRLAPGADVALANLQLDDLSRRLGGEFAGSNASVGARVVPLLDDLLGYYRPALIVLVGAVAMLLLIACLNVASLLLTRAMSREREIAVRTALGATPRHLLIQLLAEGAVLAAAGAGVGVLAAYAFLPIIRRATPVPIPRLDTVAIDLDALLVAIAIAVVTSLVFGLVPSAIVRRRAVAIGLRTVERGASRTSSRLYRALVAGEIALACALIVSSALLIRTVGRMSEVDTGISRPDAVTASIQMSAAAYPDWAAVADVHSAILEDLRQRPGIRAAGATNFLPFETGWRLRFVLDGEVFARPEDQPLAQFHAVTEGYFDAIGARLAAGRFFTDRDDRQHPPAVVVNEAFARRFLAGSPGIGRSLVTSSRGIGPLGRNLMPADARYEIVGTVADVRNMGFGQPIEPSIYFSVRQYPFRSLFLAVDATDDGVAMSGIQAALRQHAPAVPAADVRTLGDRLSARTAEPRLLMTLLVFFGALAGILAALGVYGLFSWIVALRRRELAIRLTLGARPARVGGLVLRQAGILAVAGLAGGWVIVQLGEQALARVLYEVAPGDARALASAASILLAATLASCVPAAWRAMRVDPAEGLRTE